MRIALIAHTNSPWAPKYANIFKSKGHDVLVISYHSAKIPGIETRFVGTDETGASMPKWAYPIGLLRVRKILKAFKPDVTLATYFRSNGLVGAITKCSPLVVSSRGIDQEFRVPLFGKSIARWICRRADALHAVSDELRSQYISLGVAPAKITTFPLGTDLTRFKPAEDKPASDRPRLICTRKHSPIYDNLTLIRALAQLKHEGFAFDCRFLGTNELTDQLKAATTEAGLDDCVTFISEVAYEEVPEQLRWADIYLSASLSDGTSSSLLEALCSRLFVVVTDIEGNRPWIKHEQNGCMFPTGDAEACARMIRWIWKNRKAVLPGIDATCERIDREANLHRNTDKLEQLLMSVADKA